MIYLASPYSHSDETVRKMRYSQTLIYTTRVIKQGVDIFSPIVYGHQLHLWGGLPYDADFWSSFNRKMVKACSEVHVLRLEGWQHSKGIKQEKQWAEELGLAVRMVDF